ncbi:CNH domain-containing protein [Lentinula edodes]|nr:CNH domain-containing protein [Lentinula edodes]
MENKRPLSPEVPDEDLQQLYDQVWAGFGSEDTQSIESASSYTPSTASVLSPRDGVRRQDTSEQDREDIGRIYSVYATDNLPDVVYNYGSPSTTGGSNIYQHQQDTDNYSGYISSPISPVSTAAATYARSARSASIRSNGRERSGSGSARRLPLPPTPANGWNAPTQMTTAKEYQRQGHVSSMSTSSISSVASSRKLPATPTSAPVVTLGGKDLYRLGVGLPTSPRPSKSPSPTRGRGGVDSGLSLAADYLQPEANLQPRRNRSRSPYQTNRSMQVVSGSSANTSPALVAAPLPPSQSPRSYFDEKSRKDPGLSMNRWNSTTSSIVNGVNAQGLRIPPPPPLLSFQRPSQLTQPQYSMPEPDLYADPNAGPSNIVRRPTDMLRELKDGAKYDRYHPEERHDQLGVDADEASYDWDEDYELQQQRNDNEYSSDEFINYSLLSHLAVQLRDKVPRGVHVKASIPYEGAFTGKDIVDTVQSLIRKHLLLNHSLSLTNSTFLSVDRRAALHVARSLQCQLLFYEVDGGGRELCDGVEEVYIFFSEDNISSSPTVLPLPTAVVTMLTRCYVPTCVDDKPCYAWDCPKRGLSIQRMLSSSSSNIVPVVVNIPIISSYPYLEEERKPWKETVPEEVFSRIPEGEVKRQVAIHDLITKETDYLADLIVLETQFMLPLSEWVSSPLLAFSPALQTLFPLLQALITAQTRLLDNLRVRARESQYGIIEGIGDLYLERAASSEWRAGWGGYDEWVGVWATCGLGGLGIFSPAISTTTDEYGNEDWKKIIVEQEMQRQQKQRESNLTAAEDESTGEVGTETGGIKEPREPRGYPLPDIDLKKFTELLALPAAHLKSYPSLLSTILAESSRSADPKAGKEKEENSDASYLREAIRAMRALWGYGKVKTFQLSMNVGASGGDDNKGSMGVMGEAAIKWEWFNLVSEEERKEIGKTEVKRQAIIFELIKGEMGYVKDLENVEHMYITPLVNSSTSNTPIIPAARLSQFLSSVFNNIQSLHVHHLTLLQALFRIQYDEHPTIRSVSAPILDAALNWREAYMEYIPNYPIAAYTIDSEMRTNPAFKDFVQRCTRHPDAHRLDMKNFINRPIPRLLRYELLLKGILEETPHEDHSSIPQVLDVIRRLGKDTEPGVVNAKSKVELWKYNEGLVFKQGEWIDMDLLAESRSLIHSGKLLRQTDGLEWSGWTELYVLLFDNYMVLTKLKEREDVTKYHVNRRPIPLDLLTIDSLTEPPVQRGTGPGLLRGLRSQGTIGQGLEASSPNELLASPEGSTPIETSSSEMSPSPSSRLLYPITLHHLGRQSVSPTTSSLIPPLPAGPSSSRTAQQAKPPPNVILYTESATARAEWGAKLQEALGIRRVVQESNKVFEIETLSSETFVTPAGLDAPDTADGRGLVAVGCAEGVWIGFRHDPKSMRRVLHLKLVAQCAMLEDYGIFLVLADKSLFAYHIEALVPSSFQSASTSQVPQKLNGSKDVHFFTVGTLHGRTLVVYMKKKGLDSIFRVLEPVSEKIKERAKPPSGFGSRLFVRSAKSEWFKIYRDFFLPSESYDVIFLKARIAILCSRGFEIMDLNDFKSVTIPQHDDPRLAYLAKRCESCRPIGMFKSAEDEFLLCYNEFGVYVDKHGDPNRPSGTIEWEGTAERVAVHAPYVLLFDSRFIEIRHLETGRLTQIIPGNDIRCIWDGRVLDRPDEPLNQDALVHAVMNAPDVVGGGSRGRFVVQQVFELLPTVPLFLPDSAPDVLKYYPTATLLSSTA